MKDFSQLDPNKVGIGFAIIAAAIGLSGMFDPKFGFFILGAMGFLALAIAYLT